MVTSARARGVVKERDVEGVCDDDDDDDKGHRDRGIQPMLIALLVSGLFHTLLPIPNRHARSFSHLPRRGSPVKYEGRGKGFGVLALGVVILSTSGAHPDPGDHPLKNKALKNSPRNASKGHKHHHGGARGSKYTESTPVGHSREVEGKEGEVVPIDHSKDLVDPYPFYKVSLDMGGQTRKWPSVGWQSAVGKNDDRFRKGFKFYMLEDGVFDMSKAEKCFRDNMKIFDANDPTRPHLLDENLRLNQRQYLVELYMWPILRKHEMRTMNPEEADMFFIGYSPYLNHQAYPCDGLKNTKNWEKDVGDALRQSKWWMRRGGRDHFLFYMKYNIMMPKSLTAVLETGVNVITTDRHYWSISHNLKQTFEQGRVLVIPYVCSTFMDSQYFDYHSSHIKNPNSHYMFFGNLRRRFGGRSYMLDLAKMLKGANFKSTELHREPIPDILNETAMVMRESTVCLCPSGDAPTSVRVFESLGSGCIPLILGYKHKMHTDMPFPSLIDWDSVALFADSLESVTKTAEGLQDFANVLESTLGSGANIQDRVNKMREEGTKVFREHMAFRRNPLGVTESVLFEAWVLLQKQSVIKGPFAPTAK